MNIPITPTKLKGVITPPPSKSQAHRLIIAAALAEGESLLSNVAFSQDIEATLNCMKALGAKAAADGGTLAVTGVGSRRTPYSPCMCGAVHLDCGESGSTLRFLIPVALAVAGGAFFTGRGRLLARPQQPYADLFAEKGVFFAHEAQAITAGGDLTPGEYRLPGNVSSQFVTGLLYALPLLDGDSDIVLTSPLESRGYVDMTLEAQRRFGVTAVPTKTGFHIPGGQIYQPRNAAVEADWSQAAFWYAAQALGNSVEVGGMDPGSTQGDRDFLDWMRMVRNKPIASGVTVSIWGPDDGTEMLTAPTGGCSVSIDVSQNPDLVPPLAAMGALMNGTLHIKNAARLRIKESDRLASVTAVLNAMGARIEEHPDSLTIVGQDILAGGVTVDSHNDHRIAMMAAVAATRCQAPVTIAGAECVAKSYPNFWEDYEALGGQIIRSEV